ncbi:unnamed protein product [Symbiodinium necroappetens]|uniref:Uncharacterized protein n=1 Tax=Symbiodinium necroappetens TaxID=1628268 RepID=A0A812YDP2_9DINO|nr:unnamed protein product [Symbiodinium necroappetens]
MDILTAFGFLVFLTSSFLKMDISRGYTDPSGRHRRVGGKDLTATGVYPATFAMNVAGLLDNHFKTMKPKPMVDELEMELVDDSCDESSDSGLENLVGNISM